MATFGGLIYYLEWKRRSEKIILWKTSGELQDRFHPSLGSMSVPLCSETRYSCGEEIMIMIKATFFICLSLRDGKNIFKVRNQRNGRPSTLLHSLLDLLRCCFGNIIKHVSSSSAGPGKLSTA